MIHCGFAAAQYMDQVVLFGFGLEIGLEFLIEFHTKPDHVPIYFSCPDHVRVFIFDRNSIC